MNIFYCVAAIAYLSTVRGQCGDAGLITIAGSTTVFPIGRDWGAAFTTKCPSSPIDITALGSSDGINGVCGFTRKNGGNKTDIGNSSRDFKSTEAVGDGSGKYTCVNTSRVAIQVPVAIDGIPIFVGKTSKIWTECLSTLPNGLTTAEVRWLFSNQTSIVQPPFSDNNPSTNYWNEICGSKVPPNTPIKIAGPASTFGTYSSFVEVIFTSGDTFRAGYIPFADNSDALRKEVVESDYAVGFLGYSYYSKNLATMQAIKVDGIEPTDTNLFQDKYLPLGRRIFTNFAEDQLKKTACFGYFGFSTEGEKLVDATGFLPVPEEEWGIYKNRLGTCGTATFAPTPAPTSRPVRCVWTCLFRPSPCCSRWRKFRNKCQCN